MSDQRWITLAGDDNEAAKCKMLARSLKHSLTTRLTQILILSNVSEKSMYDMQDEFDICTRVPKEDKNKTILSKLQIVEKHLSRMELSYKKIAYLDCNCLILENSDEIFGLNLSKSLEFINVAEENAEAVYCLSLDFNREICLSGSQFKIVHFAGKHPLELSPNEMSAFSEQSTFSNNVLALSRFLQEDGEQLQKIVGMNQMDANNAVAVIGMSCKFAGANNAEELWSMLTLGTDAITAVPKGRWWSLQETKSYFLKTPVDTFDQKFFSVHAKEALYIDPQHRLAFQLAWEALENSAIDPLSLKSKCVGVFGGLSNQDYKTILQEAGVEEENYLKMYMGNNLGNFTSRISHFLQLSGPCISTDSGCSSSMVAVHLGATSIRQGECDLAIIVGANLLLYPFSPDTLSTLLAKDGKCKPFDAAADGFGRGEGVAAIILKKLSRAISDGDNILGIIRGSAVVQEGESESMGTPTVTGEALAMQMALDRAGVMGKDVSYLEAHGTGTKVGDPIEISAVAKAYSQDRSEKLIIGSIKSNIGHTESVSGLAGIIKTLLCFKHEMIPPNFYLNKINPELDLDSIPAQIAAKAAICWNTGTTPRIAGVSSFGITGTAAHIILQEPPAPQVSFHSKQEKFPENIFTISGNSLQSLRLQVKAHCEYFKTTLHNMDDIEYTMHTGRAHLSHRMFAIANNLPDLRRQLEQFENQVVPMKRSYTEEVKICFLFTGQGSQYYGMGRDLYLHSYVFRSHLDHCLFILEQQHGIRDLKQIVFGDNDEALLRRPLYAALSIFCLEYALFKVWNSWGIFPSCVLGHSLGEFGAAVAASIITLPDALKLIVHRSQLVEEESLPGRMIAVAGNKEFVEKHLQLAEPALFLEIAALNAEDQTVLSGTMEQIQAAKGYFGALVPSISTKILCATHGFHSHLMDNILNKFSLTTRTITYSKPSIPYISSVEGSRLENQMDSQYWVKHLRNKVRFLPAFQSMEDQDIIFLEIGPTAILSALITSSNPERICLPSLRKGGKNEFQSMLQALGTLYSFGVNVNWKGFHRYSSHNKRKVDLPNYQFHLESYWCSSLPDSKAYHPLLGVLLPTPCPAIVFSNQLSLSTAFGFLRESKVQNLPLLAPAVFLEISLMAALYATELPLNESAPKISNIRFHVPAKLNEGKSLKMQTVVDQMKNSKSFEVRVYSKYELDWILHSSADFIPAVGPQDFKNQWDLHAIQARLANNTFSIPPIPELLPFLEIKKSAKTMDEILLEIHVPLTIATYQFVIQPALLHNIFQAASILHQEQLSTMKDEQVTLISQIQELVVLPINADVDQFYAYAKRNPVNKSQYDTCLFDGDGNILVSLQNLEFSTVSEKQLCNQLQPTPMFVEKWEKNVSPSMESNPQVQGACFIVFTGDDDLSQQLLAKLREQKFAVVEIQLATEIRRKGQILCSDQDSLESKLNTIFSENVVQGVLFLWGLTCKLNCEEMVQPCFYLCKYLAKEEDLSLNMVLFTRGLFPCTAEEVSNPMSIPNMAPLVGMLKSFRNENHRFHCKVVDLNPRDDDTEAEVGQALAEMLLCDGEFSIAYRNSVRMVHRLVRFPKKHIILSPTSLFNGDSTYLVTGGMGGIGFEVGRWLIKCGAKFLVLVSRSTFVSEEKQRALGNTKIALKYCDIGSLEDCTKLLQEIQEEGFPPLRGVFHTAGIIRDARFENLEWSTYPKVFRGKLWGAWNLHQLTLNMDLQHFVMFSSLATIVGSGGQSNYTAANYFLDYLSHYRRSLGLQATSINWGQWGEVGMAAEMQLSAVSPFSVKQGISGLEQILLRKMTQVTVAKANFTLLLSGCITMRKYADSIEDTEMETEGQKADTEINNVAFWSEYDECKTLAERQQKIVVLISRYLSYVLKLDENEMGSGNFKKLGMDSLMTIEMKNFLHRTLQHRAKITNSQLRGCITVQLLAARIVELLNPNTIDCS